MGNAYVLKKEIVEYNVYDSDDNLIKSFDNERDAFDYRKKLNLRDDILNKIVDVLDKHDCVNITVEWKEKSSDKSLKFEGV
jgi:phosphopentomutase